MKKILVIVGTRPEAIKLLPLYLELKTNRGCKTLLVSTGQHREMLSVIFNFFKVVPDFDMNVMTRSQSLEKMTLQLIEKCVDYFKNANPDLIIVQGDTTSSMTGAVAAFYRRIPVAHVEAGLRSYDKFSPFPEEFNRRVISLIADFHFAPTKIAASAIKRELVRGKILVVGNTVIDSLIFAQKEVIKRKKELEKKFQFISGFEKMILITGHRRESFGQGFLNICESITKLAQRYRNIVFLYPVHLNPNVKGPVFEKLDNISNVHLIEPVSYDEMVYLMMRSFLIMTDSGGIQEEAPSLGKPVVILREVSERPEGIKSGCSVLAGTSAKKIIRVTKGIIDSEKIYMKMARAVNPYGSGDSAKKIAGFLNREFIMRGT